MNTQEKLEFIVNHSSELETQDWATIRRIYIKLKTKVEAKQEENEILGDALYSYSGLTRKRLELDDLMRLLKNYVGEKGLMHSSLRIEELLSMINSDIRHTGENIDFYKESIDGIKTLLNQSK